MLYSADKFANEFYEHKKVSTEMKNPINKNVSGPVYTCIADMDKTFPVFPKIVDEFCYRYCNMDGQLVVYIENNSHKEDNLQSILQTLSDYQDINCSVQIIDDETVSGFSAFDRSQWHIFILKKFCPV